MKTNFAILQRLIDQNRSPSVQYFHFEKDKILAEFRSGVSQVLAKKPVDQETTYPLYSVTKTFTALAIFQLIEAGKIDVKSSAALYHPAFPYDHEITIHQLLTHTSGIPNPIPLSWIHLAEEHEGFDRNLFFKNIFIKHPKLKFKPGTRFSYSNPGYVLIGQIIEHVSGKTLEQYFFDHIIDPSGIEHHDLGFTINDRTQATGYHKTWSFSNFILGFLLDKKKFMGKPEGRWTPFHKFYINGTAYGGLIGTPVGLIKYAQSLLKHNSPLISQSSKELLLEENVIHDRPTGMAHAWWTGSLKKIPYRSHAGGGGGFYIELRIYPDLNKGSVIIFNRTGLTDERILDKVDIHFL